MIKSVRFIMTMHMMIMIPLVTYNEKSGQVLDSKWFYHGDFEYDFLDSGWVV